MEAEHRDWPASTELAERLAVIDVAAPHFHGVGEIEHLLVGVRDLLRSERMPRHEAVAALLGLVETWPYAAAEVLEFTMRDLQWPEVRSALTAHADSEADFRTRDQAKRVLEVYQEEWPGGEIYRTYG